MLIPRRARAIVDRRSGGVFSLSGAHRAAACSLLLIALVASTASGQAMRDREAPASSLPAFRSERQLRAYLLSLRAPPPPRRRRSTPVQNFGPCPTRDSTSATSGRRWWSGRSRGEIVFHGVVRAANGRPIEGASVTLPCLRRSASTDSTGAYRFVLPRSARREVVWVMYRAIGYVRVLDSVRVRDGREVVRDQQMQQDVLRLEQVVVTQGYALAGKVAGAAIDESITNTQHEGVDEGGIVKLHGDHLVVLRRGRLFTVRVGDDALAPAAMVDAYPPDPSKRGGWYDELLVHGDRAIVVGYSYAREATEINLFHLDASGGIRYEATYHLRSNDYYSSRNYASRVVDGTLFLYSPLWVSDDEDPLSQLPAMRRWRSASDSGTFAPIATPERVHFVPGALERGDEVALHAVTRCDLTAEPLRCDARVLIGPPSEVFYVSPTAVYLWTSAFGARREGPSPSPSLVVRLPLDGAAPRGLRAAGSPVDQFSFDESAGALRVLTAADGEGAWMWSSEGRRRDLSLVSIPIESFGDGSRAVPASAWRALPDPGPGALVNRFVGAYLLYGGGESWGSIEPKSGRRLVLVPLRGGVPSFLELGHRVDRIERMGPDAVVVGGRDDDLHLTAVRLADLPRLGQRYVLESAAQAESRSHGFFYRARDEHTGMLGLPIAGAGRRLPHQLRRTAAEVVFVRNDGDAFTEAGTLAATSEKTLPDDACVASCMDWYGNARPIFLRGRVYALMGYEIVEGREVDGRVEELRRVRFLPAATGNAQR